MHSSHTLGTLLFLTRCYKKWSGTIQFWTMQIVGVLKSTARHLWRHFSNFLQYYCITKCLSRSAIKNRFEWKHIFFVKEKLLKNYRVSMWVQCIICCWLLMVRMQLLFIEINYCVNLIVSCLPCLHLSNTMYAPWVVEVSWTTSAGHIFMSPTP